MRTASGLPEISLLSDGVLDLGRRVATVSTPTKDNNNKDNNSLIFYVL